MHPFHNDNNAPYFQQQPNYYYWGQNPHPNPMIADWQNAWYGGPSQSQLNYRGPTPHYGWGFQDDGAMYLPHQTAGPANPFVAPELWPPPQGNWRNQNFGPTNPFVAPEPQPPPQANLRNQIARPNNPFVGPKPRPPPQENWRNQTVGPTNPVVAPEPQPPLQANCRNQTVGPTNPVVAPESQPSPKANQTVGPTNPIVAPESRPSPKANQTVGQTNPVVAPEPRPLPNAKGRIQTAGPTNLVVATESRPLPKAKGRIETAGPTNPVVAPEPRPLLKAKHRNQTTGPTNHVVAPEPRLPPKAKCRNKTVGPTNPVVALEPRRLPKGKRRNKIVGPTNSVVSPKPPPLPKAKYRNQTAGSTNPIVAQEPRPPSKVLCRICGVIVSSLKSIEQHNNGKRHRRMLMLHEESEKQKAINRQEGGQMSNSIMNSVVQSKIVQNSERNRCMVEHVTYETTVEKHKDYLKKDIKETSKVLVEKPEGETRDNFVAQGHDLKRKRCKIRGTEGVKCMKTNEGIRRPIELSKPDVNALSNCVESLVQVPSVAPPQGPTVLQDVSPALAVGSDLEPQIQLVLQPELEHQVLEAEPRIENQNPLDETNVQLPSSIIVEFDAPTTSSTDTETSNGSFKAEEKMDVLTTELMKASLAKVNVCLKCGDQGYKETLVFCDKCQIYGLHRYCLDGPVIFYEDVTWFCEDCDPKIAGTSSNDESTCLPSGTSDTRNLEKDAIQARKESTNCINQVGEITQHQQQNIVDKTKVQLSDRHNSSHHSLPQCSNVNLEGENKSKKQCQEVPKDATAHSSEEPAAVENTQAAASDDPNFVEPEGHVVSQPIVDPIWRGKFCLHNESTGTIGGLLAHMSNLACSRVQEETRLLPEELSVDLLHRSAVWPNGFTTCGPNHDSIALYLFPENERSERDFNKLVDDIIHSDLAMRAVLEHAELLVFPSMLLPVEYQRFQAKYYLWGVFRAKQTSSK